MPGSAHCPGWLWDGPSGLPHSCRTRFNADYRPNPYYLGHKRPGEEGDVRYLMRYLNVKWTKHSRSVTRYCDESQLQPKTRLALEKLLSGN